ncbi:CASP-like protein 4A2 [Gallus gallus]|uniref:CASP-like protein 4A2 n=1 Tax=Gallus gallus TaxID=9031 RepID=UPI001F00198A|nr:CASP-like protein 4A2 [Gallus gallus]
MPHPGRAPPRAHARPLRPPSPRGAPAPRPPTAPAHRGPAGRAAPAGAGSPAARHLARPPPSCPRPAPPLRQRRCAAVLPGSHSVTAQDAIMKRDVSAPKRIMDPSCVGFTKGPWSLAESLDTATVQITIRRRGEETKTRSGHEVFDKIEFHLKKK